MSEKEEKIEEKDKEKHKSSEKELLTKIAELEEELKQTTNKLKEHQTKANQYLSTASYYKNESETTKKDFERFKERNKNIEKEASVKAKEEIAKKLLPIIDNFDQAIAHVDNEIMKGFNMIYNSLLNCLTDFGIVEIETDGKFNPEFHNCIETQFVDVNDENATQLSGNIATVFQKGYKFEDSNKVIRPATVSVYSIATVIID